MEYKISGLHWLCVRLNKDEPWIPIFPLTPEQIKDHDFVRRALEEEVDKPSV